MMNEHIAFYPIQPEWKKFLTRYRQINLPFPVNQHIAYMYEFEILSPLNVLIPGIPDACIDFIFCSSGLKENNLVVASPPTRIFMEFKSNVIYTGLRLLPQQRIFNYHVPIKQIFEKVTMPLFEVTDFPYYLYEQFLTKSTLEEKANIIYSFLLNRSHQNNLKNEIIQACLKKITDYHGILKIKELEQCIGYSERYLRILFNEYIGLTPKEFIQLYRFQITVQKMTNLNGFRFNRFIEENLYYDESHFYKNFERFVNMTPSEYIRILNKVD